MKSFVTRQPVAVIAGVLVVVVAVLTGVLDAIDAIEASGGDLLTIGGMATVLLAVATAVQRALVTPTADPVLPTGTEVTIEGTDRKVEVPG